MNDQYLMQESRFYEKKIRKHAYLIVKDELNALFQEGHRRDGGPLSRQRGEPIVRRSALGLVAIYNLLPKDYKREKSVKDFQRRLQDMMKSRAKDGREEWAKTFSPRIPLHCHPVERSTV